MRLISELDIEARLLLLCARLNLDAASVNALKNLVQEDIDWDRFLVLAHMHRIVPLVYRHLKGAGAEDVPPALLQELQTFIQFNTLDNLALSTELIRLVGLLDQHNVQAIPYKGPVLASMVYGDLSLRQFGDLDIIVRKQDRERTRDLLIANGYQLQSEVNVSSGTQLAYEYHWHFVGEDGIIVELHWAFTYKFMPFPFDLDHLWSRVEVASIGGTAVLNLPVNDQLLILSMHGFKHMWSRLAWVCDIAELLRIFPDLDWTEMLNQARRLQCEHILLFGLFVAQELLDAPLPEHIQSTINYNPHVQLLLTRVDLDFLFAPDEYDPTKIDQVVLAHLATLQSRTEKAGYFFTYLRFLLIRVIPPSEKDKEFLPLPDALSFLYYIIRPIRLLKNFGLKSIGLLK